jgi:TIGR03009 family protein
VAGRERPAAEPLRVDPLPKELQVILEDWEAASSKIVALYGEHRRFVYDKTFSIEKQGQGKLYYESPDRGRYEVEPSVIPKGAESRKVDKDGNAYTLKPHERELWVCTGAEVIQVNEDRKEFDRYPIPPEDRGENIMNGPLPFLFGMKAEQARQRYFLALMRDDQQKGEVWIHAKPRMQQDAALWSDAIIILDKETFLPRAVQLVDPTGNQTTVHTFTKLVPKSGFDGIASLIKGNPFEFNPKGYKQRVYEGDGTDLPARGTKPAAGKVPAGNIVDGSPRTAPTKGGLATPRTATGAGTRVNN